MSDWFRGKLEGSYIGMPARVKPGGPLVDLVPYDLRLYRATISAIQRIPNPNPPPPPKAARRAPDAAPDSSDATDSSDVTDARGADESSDATDASAVTDAGNTTDASSATDSSSATGDSSAAATAAPDAATPPPPDPKAGAKPRLVAPTLPPPPRRATSTDELFAAFTDSNAPNTPSFRQAELEEVTFVGVGSAEARDLHAAYDLRLENVELMGSTEVDGRIYGRLTADVVGSLFPTDEMKAAVVRERHERRKREKRTGAWVEGIRWVLIVGGAWLLFGLCGTVACLLWLGVTLFGMLTRTLLRSLVPASPAVRVLGWTLVLAAGGLAWLLYHRVTTVQCASANWWLLGIATCVVVSSVLYSRFAFLWTKVVWLATLGSLCYASREHRCSTAKERPSVVDQGPRTEPDGHWPKHPEVPVPPLEGIEAREAAVRISVAQAIIQRDTLWNAPVPIVIHVPLARLFNAEGAVTPSTELYELTELLKKGPGETVLFEVHGKDDEDTDTLARTASAWFVEQGVPPTRIVARGVGGKYPMLPTDGLGGDVELNRRLEVRIARR